MKHHSPLSPLHIPHPASLFSWFKTKWLHVFLVPYKLTKDIRGRHFHPIKKSRQGMRSGLMQRVPSSSVLGWLHWNTIMTNLSSWVYTVCPGLSVSYTYLSSSDYMRPSSSKNLSGHVLLFNNLKRQKWTLVTTTAFVPKDIPNEFAVVNNHWWAEWYVRKTSFCSYFFIYRNMVWIFVRICLWGDSTKYPKHVSWSTKYNVHA